MQPDWSPDGKRVVFELHRPQPLGSEIYTVDADGSSLRLLAGGPGFDGSPRWSPDGRLVLFVSRRKHEHSPECATCTELYVIAPDKRAFGRLTRKGVNAVTPAWSPRGKRIVWARGVGPRGPLFLWIMRADTIGAAPLGVRGLDPSWSPDGRFIVFSRGGALFRVRADGRGETRLTARGPLDANPDW